MDGDQSSSEQQNGLLQLLYEMDSYDRDDKVRREAESKK